MSESDRIPQARVYFSGFTAGDFVSLRPGLVLVEPVFPPSAVGNIILAEQTKQVLGNACQIYRVLRAPDVQAPDDVKVKPGDIVSLRNAALEPIHPKQGQLVIAAKHIHGVVAEQRAEG